MLDPQQELFTAVRAACMSIGDTYDTKLPPEGTPYPFIYLGQVRDTEDMGFKSETLADVYIDVHVWHNNPRKRGTVSSMMAGVKDAAFRINRTPHFGWQYRGTESNIITDTTTKEPLMHGILTVQFKLLGGYNEKI